MIELENAPTDAVVIGFDSAWTDSPTAPGAICAIAFDHAGRQTFHEPQLASFAQALAFIQARQHQYSLCLVAIDQPTIVPNLTGCRPVERVAGSLVSFAGGGVQPANRSKLGMFCDASPIWKFRDLLGACEDPEKSREADEGTFLIEVFPALALPGLHEPFSRRMGAPKYNPANRRRFKREDWQTVTSVVARIASDLAVPEVAQWADSMTYREPLRKAQHDMLDSLICLVVGLVWRACGRSASAMIGDLGTGYMVTPVTDGSRLRLQSAAERHRIPFA